MLFVKDGFLIIDEILSNFRAPFTYFNNLITIIDKKAGKGQRFFFNLFHSSKEPADNKSTKDLALCFNER